MAKFDVFTTKFAQDIFLQKYSMNRQEKWEDTSKRVVDAVCGQLLNNETKEKIFKLILERKFIPGGRYLYSSGRAFHQVNNCFLFRAEDSREGWSDIMYKTSMSLMTGGGIGIDYSKIRADGEIIRRTGGHCTGPIALMEMVNESGRHIMQGGARRCIPEGERVQTEKGLIPIEELKIGDKVFTTDGYRKVKAKLDQGVQKTLKIKTQNGDLICTPNHRVAVVTSVYGNYEWKEAQNLKEGDRLYFGNNLVDGEKTELPKNDFFVREKAYTLKKITVPKLDTDVAWLLGLFHGDGYVYLKNDNESGTKRHGKVQISCSKDRPEIKDKAFEILSKFATNVKIKDGDGELWNVTCYSLELAHYFSKFKRANETITVPDFIMRGLPEIRAAYIAGLMDADGSSSSRPILIAAQIYPEYLKQVQNLCSSLGIATRLKLNRKSIGNWKNLYHLTVSTGKQLNRFKAIVGEFGHKCNFSIPNEAQQYSYSLPNHITNESGKFKHRSYGINTSIEKIEEELGPLPYTPVKVIDLIEHDELSTWDIEVEDKTEFFINGYLVHNSAIWAGLNWKHGDVKTFLHLKDWSDDLKKLKEKDFTFRLPMEGTNISVIYDTDFFVAIEDKNHENHKLAKEVWKQNCIQAFSTAEPGMSFNFLKDNESLRNACTEVTSEDDSDKCNLGTLWINRFENKEEFAEACNLATKFLICGGIYSDVPTPLIKEVGEKNNRIGLGLGGLHEWLMIRDYGYEVTPELHKWLNIYEQENDASSYITAKDLNVAIPKGKRAIAPTGTIGILAETTTGIEPLFCKAYKRRYLDGKKWKSQLVVDGTVKRLLDKGVNLESIKDSYDIGFKERVKFQADVQNYVDMSISSTCNLPFWGSDLNNEKTVEKNSKILLKYAKRLRGFTCYPDGARGGQPLSRVSLDEALAKEGTIFEENEHECLGGVCGV